MGSIRLDIEKFDGIGDWDMEEEDESCSCITESVHCSR